MISYYRFSNQGFWTFYDNSFYLRPMNYPLTYDGVVYETREGISSIALGPVTSNSFYRNAYYSPYGSLHQFYISTELLQNETASENYLNYIGNYITNLGARGNRSHTNTEVIEPNSGMMFFTLPIQDALGCWDVSKAVSTFEIAFEDPAFTYPWDIQVCKIS